MCWKLRIRRRSIFVEIEFMEGENKNLFNKFVYVIKFYVIEVEFFLSFV